MRQVVSWSEYFMRIAETVAIRSKDPSTQVGAILVDDQRHIIGTGYNGMPPGYKETAQAWEKPNKYKHVIHAEMNAILHANAATDKSTLYTTLSPCPECAKLIITAGISKVYYRRSRDEFADAMAYFDDCGIPCISLRGETV